MKNTLLSLFVIAAGMSMVACSDNSGGGSAAINQCNNNPTAPGCIGQPVPLAQVGGNAPVSASVKAFQQNNPGANQVNLVGVNGVPNVPAGTLTGVGGKTGVPVTQQEQAIRDQAQKVAEALQASNNDPRSPYYIPPKSAEAETRSPSSSAPPSVDNSIAASAQMDGTGEASR